MLKDWDNSFRLGKQSLHAEVFWIISYLQDSEAMLPLLLPLVFLWLGFNIITLVNDICLGVMLWVSLKHLETVCIVIDAVQIKLNWIELNCSPGQLHLHHPSTGVSLSLLCMYPNHLSLASLIFSPRLIMAVRLMFLFLILSIFVTPTETSNITLERKAGRSFFCLLF